MSQNTDHIVSQHPEGITVWRASTGWVYDEPTVGWYLVYSPALEDRGWEDAFPTHDAAIAALHGMAAEHGRTVSGREGDFLDLTHPGCAHSCAFVGSYERRRADRARAFGERAA